MYFLDNDFCIGAALFVIAYWLLPARARNSALLAGAVAWLGYFSPSTLIALSAITAAIVYPTVRCASQAYARGDVSRAAAIGWLGVGAVIGIAIALRLAGYMPALSFSKTYLQWIGFSYFLLKAIATMRLVATGICAPPSFVALVQFMLFLPTLSSGPLYRIDAFTPQYHAAKRFSAADLETGLIRITLGLAKKVLLALQLSKLTGILHADYRTQPLAYPVTYVILYFDFSGYSDIAVGLGCLLGYRVPENFKHPLTATTMTQFWRNWHASLGDWVRETVFVPLGGMRTRGARLYAVVIGSMLVVGIWHGFAVPFIGWGIYHGIVLVLENALGIKPLHAAKTSRWRRYLRYGLVQATAMGGMFAFIGLGIAK